MGQTGSSLLKKAAHPFKGWTSSGDRHHQSSVSENPDRYAITPFVFKRTGSQYFDEDGDLAHEFYIQTRDKSTRRTYMKKLDRNLVPQGDVPLDHPRLNVDMPMVLYEAQAKNR